jgi:hypothetical protein
MPRSCSSSQPACAAASAWRGAIATSLSMLADRGLRSLSEIKAKGLFCNEPKFRSRIRRVTLPASTVQVRGATGRAHAGPAEARAWLVEGRAAVRRDRGQSDQALELHRGVLPAGQEGWPGRAAPASHTDARVGGSPGRAPAMPAWQSRWTSTRASPTRCRTAPPRESIRNFRRRSARKSEGPGGKRVANRYIAGDGRSRGPQNS